MNLLLILVVSLLSLGSIAYGDVDSTRDALRVIYSDDSETLDAYDKLTDQWIEYKENHTDWDYDPLLLAIEYRANKQADDIVSSLNLLNTLWSEGTIRNVNILASAHLHPIQNGNESEIESLFGPGVMNALKILNNKDPVRGLYRSTASELPQLDEISSEITVTVKFLTGKTYAIPISRYASFYDLKVMIEKATGAPVADQRLVMSGKTPADYSTLPEYHIFDGITINVVIRPRW